MILKEFYSEEANKARWDALRMLDWEKDRKTILSILSCTNPIFFTNRTPDQIIQEALEDVEMSERIEAFRNRKKEMK